MVIAQQCVSAPGHLNPMNPLVTYVCVVTLQVLTSAEHVSCLVSLPDLHDLLLENPKVPDGASVTFDLQVRH